jgi:hypothetical protein
VLAQVDDFIEQARNAGPARRFDLDSAPNADDRLVVAAPAPTIVAERSTPD